MTRRRALARAVFRIALRTLKWGTLAAALIVAGVWAGGERTACDSFQSAGGSWTWLTGHPGGIEFNRHPPINLTLVYSIGPEPYWDREPIWVPSVRGLLGRHQTVHIPYWLPILLFASISGGLFWRDRRASRRAKTGECPSCGYSRAGLALEAVCPECGNAKT